MENLLLPVVILAIMGFIFAVALGFISEKFHVEKSVKEAAVRNALPGANCGACGFPGCDGLANAIAKGTAAVNSCSVGGQPVSDKVGEIMGVNAETDEKMIATVLCQGSEIGRAHV